jgi:predicted nucleotidyltransferase
MDEFKRDLSMLNSLQIVRKHIFNGHSQILSDHLHYRLKETICEKFGIDFNDVLLVGSGKTGFSIKPTRRYGLFGEDSDLDLAVVSSTLFTKIWKEVHLYKRGGAYWPQKENFFKSLSEGWIRPDKLPQSQYFDFSKEWWDFFTALTTSGEYGPYKIRAGLYQSWFFLEEYQKICVEQCIEEARN